MTPIELLEQLVLFCKEHTKDLILPVKTKPSQEPVHRAPEVWPMRLPDKQAEQDKVPYILLQVVNGGDKQDEGGEPSADCYIRIVIGVYSSDASEGAMQVLNIITRLRTALLKQRLLDNRFLLKLPLEFLIYPDDTAPYYFGEMATTWSLPTINWEV